jgi:hypothetical protein
VDKGQDVGTDNLVVSRAVPMRRYLGREMQDPIIAAAKGPPGIGLAEIENGTRMVVGRRWPPRHGNNLCSGETPQKFLDQVAPEEPSGSGHEHP